VHSLKLIFLVQNEDIKDICLALPCLALPCLPCLALPCLALPKIALSSNCKSFYSPGLKNVT
jgi:hypothetical protein